MPRRPTAFEVSFPELANEAVHDPEPSSSTVLQKRKSEHTGNPPVDKRLNVSGKPVVRYYVPKPYEVQENEDLLIVGECFEDENDRSKPVRVLSNFTIFDPNHKMEMMSLRLLGENRDPGRSFEGAGTVLPFFANEEDEGQEDGLDEDEAGEPPYIRLSAICQCTFDYLKQDDPIYIETMHAWYILKAPSRRYRPTFSAFYKPRKIAQIVLSAAHLNPDRSFDEFLKDFIGISDPSLNWNYSERDLAMVVPEIRIIMKDIDRNDLTMTPIIRHVLREQPRMAQNPQRLTTRSVKFIEHHSLTGNLDLAVLRAECQNPTVVTPFIASLASDLFREQLVIMGPRPIQSTKNVPDIHENTSYSRVVGLVSNVLRGHRVISARSNHRLKPRSPWLRCVSIDGEMYNVGDTIIVPMGNDGNRKAPELPTDKNSVPIDATIADYFWFAKIISINDETETVHIQWFEHSSKTMLEEIGDAQDLFLTYICDTVDLHSVVGKANVHYGLTGFDNRKNNPDDFFCKFVYDANMATFMDVDLRYLRASENKNPPNNCPVCVLVEQHDQESYGKQIPHGLAFRGVDYHVYDFVLIRAENGPCNIGHLLDIRFPSRLHRNETPTLVVRLFGRVNNIESLPESVFRDDRHLFATDEKVTLPIQDLIRPCFVFPSDSIPHLESWSLSHDHFYVQYHFPSLHPESWMNKRRLLAEELLVCKTCCQVRLDEIESRNIFAAIVGRNPLRAFDPFGGVGGFALGMEETGCIKITHAVEISPSAAKTFRHNSPETVIYNACANAVLRHAIKIHEGKPSVLRSLHDDSPLPSPPQPGYFDCIIAGFPCQPHSRLNMFQKAADKKSNLILNVLSWVDFLKPKYCVFENVPGFLHFNLNATQAGRHKLEGGIEQGGLKFVIHALISMHYQVRFGLLQAAHYGTPQNRIRLFIIAAKHGLPLPELPQPTHDFPLSNALEIKLSNGSKIQPIRTARGTAPYTFVSIDDAISDLPRFDWKNPQPHYNSNLKQREARDQGRTIPSLICSQTSSHTGFKGQVPYHHVARNVYQRKSRKKPTEDLQHFTRNLIPKKVERVINIPLHAKADYRSLQAEDAEWQFANPSSATAKAGYRPGMYGRLDKDGWFSTTVTNIDPTAKQSHVLNPYCKRIVTVRELARSQGFPDHFIFHSINNSVVTMHRQIGNAVPWQVATALGKELKAALFKKWLTDQDEAIVLESGSK